MTIQLLVSVRNADEAIVARDAGADIIDIKEPSNGALGFAGTSTVNEVVGAVGQGLPVSAAFGESTDWLEDDFEEAADESVIGLSFVKLGLAGLAELDSAAKQWQRNQRHAVGSPPTHRPTRATNSGIATAPPWKSSWEVAKQTAASRIYDVSASQPDWVAVAYADNDVAQSPSPEEILAAAIETDCRVFLIDTFRKDGRTTLDCVDEFELASLKATCSEANLKLALAGQLTRKHLPEIFRIQPDIFAVRGAVCDNNERSQTIDPTKVRELKSALVAKKSLS